MTKKAVIELLEEMEKSMERTLREFSPEVIKTATEYQLIQDNRQRIMKYKKSLFCAISILKKIDEFKISQILANKEYAGDKCCYAAQAIIKYLE